MVKHKYYILPPNYGSRFMNRLQNDVVKSADRCRLLNRWPRKPEDKVVLHLVSGKTKSEMMKLF